MVFNPFEPAHWMTKRVRRFGDEEYGFYGYAANRLDALMQKDMLSSKHYKIKIAKKTTKTFGTQYEIWARRC